MVPLTILLGLICGVEDTDATPAADAAYPGAIRKPACGVACLFATLRLLGDSSTELGTIEAILGTNDKRLHSFRELADAARALGHQTYAAHLTREDLACVAPPFIAHTRKIDISDGKMRDHYVVVIGQSADRVQVLDSPFRPYRCNRKLFNAMATGNVLLFPTTPEQIKLVSEFHRQGLYSIMFRTCLGALGLIGILLVVPRLQSAGLMSKVVLLGRSLRRYPLTAFVAVAAVTAGATLSALLWPRGPGLYFGPVVALGPCAIGKMARTVELHNTGSRPLQITRVHSSCTCATVRLFGEPIPAHQSRELQIDVDVAPGPGKVEFLVESNDPSGPRRFTMLWNGIGGKVTLAPPEVRATADDASEFSSSVSLVAADGSNIEVDSITGGDDYPSLDVSPGEQRFEWVFSPYSPGSGQLGVLPIHVYITEGAGRIRTTCDIVVRHAGQKQSLKLPIDVTFRRSFRAEPDKVLFSATPGNDLIGMKRQIRLIHPENREVSIAQLPDFISAVVQELSSKEAVIDLTVKSQPPGQVNRSQISFECGAQKPVSVDVLAIMN